MLSKLAGFAGRHGGWWLFLLCVAGCVYYGLSRGQTISIDAMNYHLYNAFAFVEGRMDTDIIPAGIHTFLNPLSDVPYYLMIRWWNNCPHAVAAVLAAWSGGLLFLFYKLCGIVFSRKQWLWIWASVFAAVGGFMFRSQLGSPNNDVLLNMCAMGAIYLMFRFLFVRSRRTGLLFWAAFIVGSITGMKYSLAPVAVALFAVLCWNAPQLRRPGRLFGLFIGAAALGFLLTNGYFMYRLWDLYGNPVFPYFNQIFQSPFFAPESLQEARFYPQTVWQWLFFPFARFLSPGSLVSEVLYDYHLAAGFVGFWVLLGMQLWPRRAAEQSARQKLDNRLTNSLLVLTGVMYVTWLTVFGGILRYVIVLEMLNGLLAMYCLMRLPWPKVAVVLAVGLLVFLGATTRNKPWGERHYPFSKRSIEFIPQLPQPEKDAMIIIWGTPLSFLATFFPDTKVFVGGIRFPLYWDKHWSLRIQSRQLNFLPDIYFKHGFDDAIKNAIARHNGPIYMLTVYWELMLDPETLNPYGLEAAEPKCQTFNSYANAYIFPNAGWALCRLKKQENPL